MWVWVRKFLEWNAPENPNQRKAAAKMAQSVPADCGWKPEFMRVCGPTLGLELPADPPPQVNPSATLPQGLPNQKQKQKQEQKEEASPPGAAPPPDPRGSRLPADWTLPEDWREWAEGERPDLDAARVAESFRDFWVGKAGKDGRKADWFATWRNWVRSTKAQPATAPKPQETFV